jgi:hypothetical protein
LALVYAAYQRGSRNSAGNRLAFASAASAHVALAIALVAALAAFVAMFVTFVAISSLSPIVAAYSFAPSLTGHFVT